jgi:hypothetical protein
MAKRPAMKVVPTSKRMKGSGESTVRYFSVYASKPMGMQDTDVNKIDKIDKLLQEARELACMLLAVKYGASRPCEHTLVKRYPPGLRDNNEYDLVCTRCGKSF